MTTFDVNGNTAICVLPWVHEYKTISGNVGPCCQGDKLHEGESMALLRQQMLQGVNPRACSKCYIKEKESGWSPRIQETLDWIKKFGEPDVDNPGLHFVDVRYDPTCNLKCKTCGPSSSTLWQKEKNIKIPVHDANKNYLKNVDKKILKKAYLAGGEPTFIKEYLVFLQELHEVNPMCEVVINTNLKKLPSAWKDIICKFSNLTIICSCDAIGTLGTYVRYPLGWSEFEDNVAWVSKNANFLQFNLVASNLTTHQLYETCTWMKQYSKNINLSILDSPEHFSEHAVPLEHRSVYIDNIKKLIKFPISVHYAMNFRTKIQYLLQKYQESNFDKTLYLALQEEIKDQDSHRKLQLDSVDRFLHSWIHG